ncbi:MAG TPA: hypothetical protein VMV22_03300 [Acidimicrobiales bacterium]|nr:hypothetical protein [Acidimicrobiales bacterium]
MPLCPLDRDVALAPDVADALLEGRLGEADAPDGFGHVAVLVRAARMPATADERAIGHRLVAAWTHVRRAGAAGIPRRHSGGR